MRIDGTGRRGVVRSRFADFDPSWSADGRRLVFVRDVDRRMARANNEIYTKNLATGAVERHTTSPAIDWNPVFSPAGASIAFSSDRGPGREYDIFILDLTTGELQRLHRDGDDFAPAWSSDGDFVLWSGYRPDGRAELFRLELFGGVLENVTRTRRLSEEEPNLSPAGTRVAYQRWGIGAAAADPEIVVRTLATGATRMLTHNRKSDLRPGVLAGRRQDRVGALLGRTRTPRAGSGRCTTTAPTSGPGRRAGSTPTAPTGSRTPSGNLQFGAMRRSEVTVDLRALARNVGADSRRRRPGSSSGRSSRRTATGTEVPISRPRTARSGRARPRSAWPRYSESRALVLLSRSSRPRGSSSSARPRWYREIAHARDARLELPVYLFGRRPAARRHPRAPEARHRDGPVRPVEREGLAPPPGVQVVGLMSHLATADYPDTAFVRTADRAFSRGDGFAPTPA